VLARLIAKSAARTLGEIATPGLVADRRDEKPRALYRTRVSLDPHHVSIVRHPLVREVEDAVASGARLIVQSLALVPGGVAPEQERDALAVLKECGYSWDAELLRDKRILMAQPAHQAPPSPR
jgi:hypothetical protein